jgi:NADPH:quinone reductase-like Zn-dependent oxidoreductase
MEERARLKALEALFDPTAMARIVALPAAGEVVIAVEASPVSRYDLMMISGNYGYRRHLPAIMGTEGVGRAIAVGNAANDAVEQALSKTSLAELIHGVG